jgi:hypothetical protein
VERYEQLVLFERSLEEQEALLKTIARVAFDESLNFDHDPFLDGLGGQPPDWYWDNEISARD